MAGVIAAPATGGLSIPISVAGKGLFFTGLAALTPSSILLNRACVGVSCCVLLGARADVALDCAHATRAAGQSQQLTGLTKLVENLKSRLEIMNQKRAEIAIAFAAAEAAEMNIQEAGNFIQDAIELEIPTFVRYGVWEGGMISLLIVLGDAVGRSSYARLWFCVCAFGASRRVRGRSLSSLTSSSRR